MSLNANTYTSSYDSEDKYGVYQVLEIYNDSFSYKFYWDTIKNFDDENCCIKNFIENIELNRPDKFVLDSGCYLAYDGTFIEVSLNDDDTFSKFKCKLDNKDTIIEFLNSIKY